METLKWSLLVALVAGVSVSTVMLRTRSLDSPGADTVAATIANEPNHAMEREAVAQQSAPLATIPPREPATPVSPTPGKADVSVADLPSESADVVRVRAEDVLATVNDRAIRLTDLVALRVDEQEQAMTPEEYESRLNRAIEVELTFQAAAAGGVKLTPEQARRVDGIAQKHEATLRSYQKEGVTWGSVTTAQVEFEQRLTSALMLQQNLVAMEAHVAPASDPSVQARYEQARSDILSRLKAQGNITEGRSKL